MLRLLLQALRRWLDDKAPRMGAALAFYTVFSLAPLLILVIAMGGIIFGRYAAESEVLRQIRSLIGPEGADAVKTLINASRVQQGNVAAAIVGFVTLLIGSTGALMELQDGLNRVWEVKAARVSFAFSLIRHRLVSLALVLGIAFLLLISLVVSALLSAFGGYLATQTPLHEAIWHGLDAILSWAVITGLFAMIYKILPDTAVDWKDVWAGSATAAIFFTVGKFLVGFYIGKSAVTSTYGAAGSFVIVLIWVYYSSLLLYFGAEFTKVYTDRLGSRRNTPKEAS